METVFHELKDGWNLVAHINCKLYSNDNEYVLLDWDNDILIQFAINDDSFETTSSSWGLKLRFNYNSKTIYIDNEPEEFEDEE